MSRRSKLFMKMFFQFMKCLNRSNSLLIKYKCRPCNTRASENVLKSPNILTSKQIRQKFIDFFSSRDHMLVPSSSVFLRNDPSLRFVISGMNQFKPIFLEQCETNLASLKRAVNSQKCIRTGDLEKVGNDLYHHTFFEMLGNWSFGDYFKRDACCMAWQLLTEVYLLPKERLYVTYFAGDTKLGVPADTECRDIWLSIGIREDHIVPFGIESNFWEMGNTGPCGSCTEIHYDHSGSSASEAARKLNSGSCSIVELWNLVFMQYNRLDVDTLELLPRNHVDTGMGMERLTCILQNKTSNYDTDLFVPLLKTIHKKSTARPYGGLVGNEGDINCTDATYRLIADHARMVTVAISDGILPDKRDAGHLLRCAMRKVFLNSRTVLGCGPGLLPELAEVVASILGDSYPELWENLSKVKTTIAKEEDVFFALLDKTSKSLARISGKSRSGFLKGSDAFRLYVESGLPEEQIRQMADEVGLKVDWQEFKKCIKHRKEKDVHGVFCKPSANASVLLQQSGIVPTQDSFKYQKTTNSNGLYKFPELQAKIVALLCDNRLVDEVDTGSSCSVILDRTNFYAEAGGQLGDKGFIVASSKVHFSVDNAEFSGKYVLHNGSLRSGTLRVGDMVTLKIEDEIRQNCMRNHTATHLLISALRQLLPNILQTSSRITPEKLFFEFAAEKSFSQEQLQNIEDCVNASIKKDIPVVTNSLTLEAALQHPDLVVLQDGTYPEVVRMVSVGENNGIISKELCCGTHLEKTSELVCFVITSHRNSGLRKRTLTAVTGAAANKMLEEWTVLEVRTQKFNNSVLVLTAKDVLDYKELTGLLQELRDIRVVLQERLHSPLLKQRRMVDTLLTLDRKCSAAVRTYNSTQLLAKVEEELRCALKTQREKRFVIVRIAEAGDAKHIFKHLDKMVDKKPTMAFVCNGEHVIVKCWVPEHCVGREFCATAWANVVTTYFGGEIYTRDYCNPKLECNMRNSVCVSDSVLAEAILAAEHFGEKYNQR